MKISVVIATHYRAKLLAAVLDSLTAQNDADFEAVVVSDGEDPDTRQLSETLVFPRPICWIFNPVVQHQGPSRNTGAREATGEILLFLDDDATAAPGWIAQHRRHHEADRDLREFLVIGRTVHVYSRPPHSRTEQLLRAARDARDARYVETLANPDRVTPERLESHSVCGFNCSIRRSVFLAAGGFDSRIYPRYEDVELGHRLHRIGVETVVEPAAILYHHDSKDLVEESMTYWKHSGKLASYRMIDKAQRSSQIAWVKNVQKRGVRGVQVRTSWEHPEWFRAGARIARQVTDRTGARWSLRLWQRLASPVETWEGMKEAGIGLDRLTDAVGAPLLVVGVPDLALRVEDGLREFALSGDGLRRVLDLLRMLRFRHVPAAEGSSESRERRVALTFDVGWQSLYSELLSFVATDSIRPLVFLVTGQIGGFNGWESRMAYRRRKLVTLEQVREMHRHGIQFGSLTESHPWLPTLCDRDLECEVTGSKHRLEDLLGAKVDCFAYPYGGGSARVRAAVARAGYRYAFTRNAGLSFWDDPFWIRRVKVSQADSVLSLILKALTGRSAAEHGEEWLWRLAGTAEWAASARAGQGL